MPNEHVVEVKSNAASQGLPRDRRPRLSTLVTIGHRNRQLAEVTQGLATGDEVILHPSDTVADGTGVTGWNE
jgi:hypothetical protein